jgi:uncharacterized membrane protein YciS (DUF1049 family)
MILAKLVISIVLLSIATGITIQLGTLVGLLPRSEFWLSASLAIGAGPPLAMVAIGLVVLTAIIWMEVK